TPHPSLVDHLCPRPQLGMLGLFAALTAFGPAPRTRPGSTRPAAAGRIAGRVEISTALAKRRANFRIYADAGPGAVSVSDQAAPVSELANVVVYLESGAVPTPPQFPQADSVERTMAQVNERFVPHVVAVTEGSSVAFPN